MSEQKDNVDLSTPVDLAQPKIDQHPYQTNETQKQICDTSDPACMSRMITAFGDCA